MRDELPLGERMFRCGCGLELDRDLNAALNLLYLLSVPANGGGPGPAQSRAETPAEREALAAHCAVKPHLDEAGTCGGR